MNDNQVPLCDFCGKELRLGSAWVFPCGEPYQTFHGVPRVASEGNWSACRACKDLIVADRPDKLAKRGTKPFKNSGLPPARVLEVVRRTQETFWANRAGPPRIKTKEEWEAGVKPVRTIRPSDN